MAKKRLYTEADVRGLAAGSELVLGANDIATPAALDLAFQRGVRVRWGDGSATRGAGTGSSAGESLWRRMLTGDGGYFVNVKGGRAEVFRIEGGVPVAFGSDALEGRS